MPPRQIVLAVAERDADDTMGGTALEPGDECPAATFDASVWETLRRMSLRPNGGHRMAVAELRPARSFGPLITSCTDKQGRDPCPLGS